MEDWINQTLNSNLDVWYFVRLYFIELLLTEIIFWVFSSLPQEQECLSKKMHRGEDNTQMHHRIIQTLHHTVPRHMQEYLEASCNSLQKNLIQLTITHEHPSQHLHITNMIYFKFNNIFYEQKIWPTHSIIMMSRKDLVLLDSFSSVKLMEFSKLFNFYVLVWENEYIVDISEICGVAS